MKKGKIWNYKTVSVPAGTQKNYGRIFWRLEVFCRYLVLEGTDTEL